MPIDCVAHQMDVIVLASPHEILFRAHGEHDLAPGDEFMDSDCGGSGSSSSGGGGSCSSGASPRSSSGAGCSSSSIVSSVHSLCDSSPPPTARAPVVKNLCGHFTSALQPGRHGGVAMSAWQHFGDHLDMYHLEGSVTAYQHYVQFKGCTGFRGIEALARDLYLDSPACLVHMGVFSASVGRRIHTAHGCFLENRIANRFRSMRVCNRIIDMSTVVKLRISRFDPAEMPFLADECAPTCADVLISGQGAMVIRVSWDKCPWTADVEGRVLNFCEWLAGVVRECC